MMAESDKPSKMRLIEVTERFVQMLRRLHADFGNENPHVTIQLAAHCDYKGSAEYNIRLSQRRAESVVNYLISKGIKKERLSPKGYGKTSPKVIKRKLTEKYTFLKENDVLTEDYVRTLSPEAQDICNQLNRRTEFRVTSTTYGMFDKEGHLISRPAGN